MTVASGRRAQPPLHLNRLLGGDELEAIMYGKYVQIGAEGPRGVVTQKYLHDGGRPSYGVACDDGQMREASESELIITFRGAPRAVFVNEGTGVDGWYGVADVMPGYRT